jgi:hypothetical protein
MDNSITNEQQNQLTNITVDKVIYKVEQCIDYQNLYALEEDFNAIGLTVQTTSNRRMILCKLVDGKVISNKIIDDFIFIGSLDSALNEISDRAASKVTDFIRSNAGTSSNVKNSARVWRNGLKMYESTIVIMNEDKYYNEEMLSENIENIADSME